MKLSQNIALCGILESNRKTYFIQFWAVTSIKLERLLLSVVISFSIFFFLFLSYKGV